MPESRLPREPQSQEQLRLLWKIVGIAFLFSSEAAAGAIIGWLIDRWLGTSGRWLLIGGATGIVVGMVSLFRATWKLSRSEGFRGDSRPGRPLKQPTQPESDLTHEEWLKSGDDDRNNPAPD
jgi:F0F1-type ATP synthase assembly protein I